MYKKVRLVSKRNEVYRVYEDGRTYIEKNYASQEDADREEELLVSLRAKGVSVPEILLKRRQRIEMQDAGEETFLGLFERAELTGRAYKDTALCIEKWLISFYSAMSDYKGRQLIRGDVNFRNFIVSVEKGTGCYSVTGVDFESSVFGRIETDIGRMAAYALTYEPAMTAWKVEFARIFMRRMCNLLSLDEGAAITELKTELHEIAKRRGQVLSFPEM